MWEFRLASFDWPIKVPPGKAGLLWLPHGYIEQPFTPSFSEREAAEAKEERYLWLDIDMILTSSTSCSPQGNPSIPFSSSSSSSSSSPLLPCSPRSVEPFSWAGEGHILATEQIMLRGITKEPESPSNVARMHQSHSRMVRRSSRAARKILATAAATASVTAAAATDSSESDNNEALLASTSVFLEKMPIVGSPLIGGGAAINTNGLLTLSQRECNPAFLQSGSIDVIRLFSAVALIEVDASLFCSHS